MLFLVAQGDFEGFTLEGEFRFDGNQMRTRGAVRAEDSLPAMAETQMSNRNVPIESKVPPAANLVHTLR